MKIIEDNRHPLRPGAGRRKRISKPRETPAGKPPDRPGSDDMQRVELNAVPAPVSIDPARTALIVVDMQNAFGSVGGMFDKAGIDITGIQHAIAPTAAAVEVARQADIKVVWIRMGFQADLSDLGAEDVPNGSVFLDLGVKEGVLTRDTWATDNVDELRPADGEPVIYKTRFSAFYRTELDELLRSWGVKNLIVTGCTTSVCVESTIRDAFFRDYHCVLLEDCAAEPVGRNFSRSNHEATVYLVEHVFGSVSSSAKLSQALRSPALTPS
jgi:ureidoacrylate peracid hydrolase